MGLRYGLSLKRLPSHCGCSKPYNIAEILEELTSDVKVKLALQPLSGKEIKENQSDEARSDISDRGFWIRGQRAFFDISVFDPTLNECYEINEQE